MKKIYNFSKCKTLDHTASHCGNKLRCGKCGENHIENSCTQSAEPKCYYCGGNPHDLHDCPLYKQRTDKVQRSTLGRSKRTFAEMLKSASAAQDENQFSVLSSNELDSDKSDGCNPSVVHLSLKNFGGTRKKCPLPKVRRKKPKVTSKRWPYSQRNEDSKPQPKSQTQKR